LARQAKRVAEVSATWQVACTASSKCMDVAAAGVAHVADVAAVASAQLAQLIPSVVD